MKTGDGTAIESCTNVGVGNTTEFILELSLDDCIQFGTEPRYAQEGEVIGRGGDNRRKKERKGGEGRREEERKT